jgi:Flp pilus assembly protein TadD
MMKVMAFALVVAPLAAASSVATAGEPVDNYALTAIQAGDMRAAEARLVKRLTVAPRDASALLNLAMVYRKTGRTVEADKLYSRVLARDDVLLDAMSGSTVWAHDLAKAKRSAPVTLATR